MKGTITRCLAELVETKWGAEKWSAIVAQVGADPFQIKMPSVDVEDSTVGKLLGATCRALDVTPEQAADAFGEYWCCTYAPRMYGPIMRRFQSAREMILGMDSVHVDLTASVPNARPPRFDYAWADDKTLRVTYKSHRDMVFIYVGLARGVGKYFKEELAVTANGNTVEIRFPS